MHEESIEQRAPTFATTVLYSETFVVIAIVEYFTANLKKCLGFRFKNPGSGS